MAKLKTLEIKGYRSIKDARLELGPLNVMIGANGTGKSNLISLFKMLNEMVSERLQAYIGSTGRGQSLLYLGPKVTPQLEAILEFDTGDAIDTYQFRLIHAANDTLMFADETLDSRRLVLADPHRPPMSLGTGHMESALIGRAAQGDETVRNFRHILNSCRVYHFHDTSLSARIRLFSYVNDNRWLMPDGGNLASMLFRYRQTAGMVYRRIVSTLRKLLREFDDFVLEPSSLNRNEIILNWRKYGSDYLLGPHQISDGTLRAMAILTLLLQPEEELPDVIILDEPELGLHPQALELVAGLIRAAASRSQVIIATQSQTLLNFFEPSEIIAVGLHEGSSAFQRLEPEPLRDWLEDYSIGELWQRNVIGAGPLP